MLTNINQGQLKARSPRPAQLATWTEIQNKRHQQNFLFFKYMLIKNQLRSRKWSREEIGIEETEKDDFLHFSLICILQSVSNENI